MKKLFILTIAATLAGCTTLVAEIENPTNGKKTTCTFNGSGLVGTVIASNRYKNCMEEAKQAGYIKIISEQK